MNLRWDASLLLPVMRHEERLNGTTGGTTGLAGCGVWDKTS